MSVKAKLESPQSPRSPSPSASPSSTTNPQNQPNPTPLPLTSPLRTHPKRNLPPTLSSTYSHGHLSGHPRTPSQAAAFEARKREILSTMTAEQIEKRYLEVSEKAREVFEEAERQREAVDAEIEAAKSMRERERRVARERMEANRKR